MSNRMPRVLLTFFISLLMLLQTCAAVSGEELPGGSAPAASLPAAKTDGSEPDTQTTETVSALTTAPEATYSAALYPVLTVSAISNYFGRVDAEYNEFTREITVVYMLKASKRLLSADWTLTYDTTLLKADPEKNTKESICPVISDDALLRIDAKKGVIHFNATDLRMFDFSTTRMPFAKIVFDTAPLTAEDSEIAKVDMSVNDLIVSEPDPKTAEAVAGKEIVLVANGKVRKDSETKTVQISAYTTITPPTFSEANIRPASKDQAPTTVPATTLKPTAPPTSAAAVTKPPAPPQQQPKKKEPPVYTGTWYVAALILAILLACSTVLFIMRKRDIYNS